VLLTVNGTQVTGGLKHDPQGVEGQFLGYASGCRNYKVQNISSGQAFGSHDMVFEEGQLHHLLTGVGEHIPLFDTILEEIPQDG
jgi:hypothetical protein